MAEETTHKGPKPETSRKPETGSGEKAEAIRISGLSASFRGQRVLEAANATFIGNAVNCLIGPSGSGKSTLIRCVNRINEEVQGFRASGEILYGGRSIFHKDQSIARLRTRIGMLFQKPTIFPASIADNVNFGARYHKKRDREETRALIERSLRAVALWEEVKDRLEQEASALSAGQQQRLCLARTLAVDPEVILLDEPTASLDPVSSRAIEDLMKGLSERYTLVFVTHNIPQARRIADHLIFLCNGKVIEEGPCEKLFKTPDNEQTREYLNEERCSC